MTESLPSGAPETLEQAATPETPAGPPRRGLVLRGAGATLAVVVSVVFVSAIAVLLWIGGRGGSYRRLVPRSAEPRDANVAKGLAAVAPRGLHLRIDTFANRLWIYRDDEALREAVCSTGSGVWLRDAVSGREWIFDTPLGERRIVRKVRNPVWSKPDWAFIEEGVEPPPLGHPARIDTVSLGDFAIYLGDGYLIHGTLFQTLLGQPLTHGCIRLGDDDLESVYEQLPIGARVYLY